MTNNDFEDVKKTNELFKEFTRKMGDSHNELFKSALALDIDTDLFLVAYIIEMSGMLNSVVNLANGNISTGPAKKLADIAQKSHEEISKFRRELSCTSNISNNIH